MTLGNELEGSPDWLDGRWGKSTSILQSLNFFSLLFYNRKKTRDGEVSGFTACLKSWNEKLKYANMPMP